MMYDYKTLQVTTRDDGYMVLTLNRPERLNAVDYTMTEELIDFYAKARLDVSVRGLILTGAGRAFSSGGDLKKQSPEDRQRQLQSDHYGYLVGETYEHDRLLGLLRLDVPTVAAINGVAVGLGADLALACDFRVAAQSAVIGEVYSTIGVSPLHGLWLLPRLVNDSWAKRLMFTGEKIDTATALRIGLVDEVVPDGSAFEASLKLLKSFDHISRSAILVVKRELHSKILAEMARRLDGITYAEYWLKVQRTFGQEVDGFVDKSRKATQEGART